MPLQFLSANIPFSNLFDFPHPWEDHARFLLRESNPSLLLRLLRKRPENPDSKSPASSGIGHHILLARNDPLCKYLKGR